MWYLSKMSDFMVAQHHSCPQALRSVVSNSLMAQRRLKAHVFRTLSETHKRQKGKGLDSVAKAEGSCSDKCWRELSHTTPAHVQAQGLIQTQSKLPGANPLISIPALALPKPHWQFPHLSVGRKDFSKQSLCQLGHRNKTSLQMRTDLRVFGGRGEDPEATGFKLFDDSEEMVVFS